MVASHYESMVDAVGRYLRGVGEAVAVIVSCLLSLEREVFQRLLGEEILGLLIRIGVS